MLARRHNTFKRRGATKRATPQAVVSPTATDLAWASGFLEGEGSFIATRHSGGHMVSAPQKQRECLDRLASLFGGTVTTRNHVTPYAWQIYGPRARGLMMTLFPLFSSRRQAQVRRALEAW